MHLQVARRELSICSNGLFFIFSLGGPVCLRSRCPRFVAYRYTNIFINGENVSFVCFAYCNGKATDKEIFCLSYAAR